MGKEFIGEDRGVAFDFHEVDGDGGDFGQHGAADGVGEGEGGVGEDEVDGGVVEVADVDAGPRVGGVVVEVVATVVVVVVIHGGGGGSGGAGGGVRITLWNSELKLANAFRGSSLCAGKSRKLGYVTCKTRHCSCHMRRRRG